jgi:hypothetical protein
MRCRPDGFQPLVSEQMGRQLQPFDVGLLNPGDGQIEAALGYPCCLCVMAGSTRRHEPGIPA